MKVALIPKLIDLIINFPRAIKYSREVDDV